MDLNAAFNEQGQVMDVVEGDTREFEDVMKSVARNELDGTTHQEGMAIVSTTLESQAAYLSTAEAQTVSTLTSQAQSAEVEVKFNDNTGLCKDAVRAVSYTHLTLPTKRIV